MTGTAWHPRLRARPRALSFVVVAIVLAIAVAALSLLLRHVSVGEVARAARAIPPGRIAVSAVLCAVSYGLLTLYDVLALGQVGRPLPYRTAALASFLGYTFSHNLGVSPLTGGSVRYRVYNAAGLGAGDVARIFSLASLTFWSGIAVATCLALAMQTGPLSIRGVALSPGAVRWVAGALAVIVVAGYALLGAGRRLTLMGWTVQLPARRQAALLLLVSLADLVVASAALLALLPSGSIADLPSFFVLYAVAIVFALITHVPGGLGTFEAVIVAGTPHTPAGGMLAALIVYRVLYYWAPLAIAGVLLATHEANRRRPGFGRAGRIAGKTAFAVAPAVFAGLAIAGALVLLVSGALPAIPARLHLLRMAVPLPFVEASQIAASLAGTALLLLAPGLYRRLDGAFLLARTMLIGGAMFSLLKGFDFEEALVLGVIAVLLQANRRAFYRRTRLTLDLLSARWIASFLLIVGVSVCIGFIAYRHVDYENELWWQFAWNGDASRFLRASFAACVLLVATEVRRLLAGATPAPAPADTVPPPFAELARAGRTEAFLALTDDKRFLRAGEAFLMYQVRGHSWIAMGDPFGPRESWPGLLWELRERAHAMQGRVLLYQISPAMVALAVELGLTLIKYGEEARVDLASFTLDGPSLRPLRYGERRAAREGARFEVMARPRVGAELETLRVVSDEWLRLKGHAEKGFSVGRFDDAYLAQFDCAAVRVRGRIVAFANLLQTADRKELSVDLMRHVGDVPYGTMDFLFANLMQWGRDAGFASFNLGMAPLAGMPRHRLAPLWARAGSMIFRHAEHLYGFEGLRAYKQKFCPNWEARFIAGPPGFGMIRALVDLQALVGGRGTPPGSRSEPWRGGRLAA
jgi:phosphatidylglycerol lysyltransferase